MYPNAAVSPKVLAISIWCHEFCCLRWLLFQDRLSNGACSLGCLRCPEPDNQMSICSLLPLLYFAWDSDLLAAIRSFHSLPFLQIPHFSSGKRNFFVHYEVVHYNHQRPLAKPCSARQWKGDCQTSLLASIECTSCRHSCLERCSCVQRSSGVFSSLQRTGCLLRCSGLPTSSCI